jgi:hypothetical protein
MKQWKLFSVIGIGVISLLLASSASAQLNFLKNPGFEDFTGVISSSVQPILADDSNTWGKWIAFSLWRVDSSGPDGNFANQVTPTRDLSQQIMQAFDGSLAPSGTTLSLTFRYLFQVPVDDLYSGTKRVRVFGLKPGGGVSPFPSYDCVSSSTCTPLYDDDDSASPGDTLISDQVPTNQWRTYGPFNIAITENFKAIVVGIMFGGKENDPPPPFRAIDDVFLGLPNRPPDCSKAYPSQAILWPPNNKFVEIQILGVTDPDDDPFTITINKIYQDEPVDSRGDGSFAPDGAGIGRQGPGTAPPTVFLRAERQASGDGRVYHIFFTADDGIGGTCTPHACHGEVLVAVPKNQNSTAVDGGALYDSTVPF